MIDLMIPTDIETGFQCCDLWYTHSEEKWLEILSFTRYIKEQISIVSGKLSFFFMYLSL